MFKNKNNLNLENVNITYNHKDDTFQITSKDSKLNGNRFSITLNQGSETEENIRKMFIRENIIESDSSIDLPKIIEKPKELNDPNSIYLGVSSKGFVKWNPFEDNYAPILFISGQPRIGKTILMENILKQVLENNGTDNVYLINQFFNRTISSYNQEFKNFTNNKNNKLDNYESVKELFLYLSNIKVANANNPTFIFIDDIYGNIFSFAGEKEKRKSQELCEMLNSLFRLCRSKHIYFIISSQTFSSIFFDPNMLKLDMHMGSKIVLGSMTESESDFMFDSNLVRKSRHNKLGRGFVSLYGETPVLFQGFSKVPENN